MTNAVTPVVDFELRVRQFVTLRDKIAEIEKADKERLAPYKALKEKMEVVMLDALNNTKQDSAATAAGTVYRTVKYSASLADPQEFKRHVIGSEEWDLLDWKANLTAVKTYLEDNKTLPPGVNLGSHTTVGVRRAGK